MILTLLITLPLLAALALVLMGGDRAIRLFSLVASAGMFILSLCALTSSTKRAPTHSWQYIQWIPNLGISYFVGVTASIMLVVLTTLLTPIVIAAS